MQKKVVLITPLEKRYREALAAEFGDFRFVDCSKERGRVAEELRDAAVAFGMVNREELLGAKKLELVQLGSAGVDGLCFGEMAERGVQVSNGSGIYSDAMAEHVLALILAFYRNLNGQIRGQVAVKWAENPRDYRRLGGQVVVGFLGTGSVGERAAGLCAAFGCRNIGYNRQGQAKGCFEAIYSGDGLGEFLGASDVVVSSLPLTSRTVRLMGRGEFRRMKRSAIFINVGRGKTVVERDLIAALEAGEIAGAGLDVFEEEPLPKESPLWRMENVIVTCHVGGFGPDNEARMCEVLADNLRRLRDGQPFVNLIDIAAEY